MGKINMIIDFDGTVFMSPAKWLVNPINCVGFMGKGLAKEFAIRYPRLNEIYKKECKENRIKIGHVYFYDLGDSKIINFPTKIHYRYQSEYSWIEEGLKDFKLKYKDYSVTSVAFPLLGCSNGGLNKDQVISLIKNALSDLDIDIYICHAKGFN